MKLLSKIFLITCGISAIVLLTGIVLQQPVIWQPFAITTSICLAIGLGAIEKLKGFQYTVWIIAAVVAGMIYPGAFSNWGPVNLRDKTLILVVIQLVMFGTGTQMSLKDFKGISTTGKGILVGMLCQFTIMPFVGYLLARSFNFEPEIAAGIILIGCCSSGLASNVMVYLARANLMLSVLVTACATLVAPFLTPFFMKLLAGTMVEVNFINMMIEIIKMVLVPIGAALLHDYLKSATDLQKRKVHIAGAASLTWMIAAILFLQQIDAGTALAQSVQLSAFFGGAVVAGIVYHFLYNRFPALDKLMPLFSMFGIIYFTTITTAAGRDSLLKIGLLLFLVAVIHNAAGYLFGYLLSRLFRLDKNSARTIALEVGLQNGGMASGIAGSMGKLGTVGLAAAVFSPWMNISGSILANYWKARPVNNEEK
ncbi:MAG: bile acid:sodium symporter family protein [Ferruginibacter sp.]